MKAILRGEKEPTRFRILVQQMSKNNSLGGRHLTIMDYGETIDLDSLYNILTNFLQEEIQKISKD